MNNIDMLLVYSKRRRAGEKEKKREEIRILLGSSPDCC